jgi:hypothetical protein
MMLRIAWCVALRAMLFASEMASAVHYTGHAVLRVDADPARMQHLADGIDALKQAHSTELGEKKDIEMLGVSPMRRVCDLRVSPRSLGSTTSFLADHNYTYSIVHSDLQAAFDDQLVAASERHLLGGGGSAWHTKFHSYDEIVHWMQGLADAHPDIVDLVTIGQTYESRAIYGLRITDKSVTVPKPAIYYDGCIHAREWIAAAVVQYIIGQLISGFQTDDLVTYMVTYAEWTLVPVLNVDGYTFSWVPGGDRMQRKNMQPNTGVPERGGCLGTDICRNSDAGWGDSRMPGQPWSGASREPCEEDYMGAHAFSTPELTATAEYLTGVKNLHGYINFHAYAMSWLTPYGYTNALPADYEDHMALCELLKPIINTAGGQNYDCGPALTTIYQANGIISDWAYDALGAKYSFAVELRGTDFVVSPNEIAPNGAEIFAAAKVMGSVILREFGSPAQSGTSADTTAAAAAAAVTTAAAAAAVTTAAVAAAAADAGAGAGTTTTAAAAGAGADTTAAPNAAPNVPTTPADPITIVDDAMSQYDNVPTRDDDHDRDDHKIYAGDYGYDYDYVDHGETGTTDTTTGTTTATTTTGTITGTTTAATTDATTDAQQPPPPQPHDTDIAGLTNTSDIVDRGEGLFLEQATGRSSSMNKRDEAALGAGLASFFGIMTTLVLSIGLLVYWRRYGYQMVTGQDWER